MKKLIITTILTINIAQAFILECRDTYTTITEQVDDKPVNVTHSKGFKKSKIVLNFKKNGIYLNNFTKLGVIGEGQYNIYFIEKTDMGNINLYSLYIKDLTLTISKAYYDSIFGPAKVNVQTLWKCVKKN